MGLLNLVEQDHLIGPAAHGFGELAAGFVADVAGRRADEPRDRVRLGVLGEVEARHRVGRMEERLGDGLRRLGFADAGRTERAGSDPMGRRPRSPAALRAKMLAMRASAGVVPDDALGEELLEAEHALAIGLQEPLDRHVGELGDDLGDVLRQDLGLRFPARRRARAPARSSKVTALSGSARPGR